MLQVAVDVPQRVRVHQGRDRVFAAERRSGASFDHRPTFDRDGCLQGADARMDRQLERTDGHDRRSGQRSAQSPTLQVGRHW